MVSSFLPADTRHQGVRGLIASLASLLAFAGFWAVQRWAQLDVDAVGAGRNYDPVVLDVVQSGLLVAMAACLLLAGLYWWVLRSGAERPWLNTVLTVTLSLAYMLLGIAYGFYTTPMGFVIMGVLAFGLVFFDRRAVLAGGIACVLVFAAYELALFAGYVDYAPLLATHMFIGDGKELTPWWAVHLRVILYVAFFAFFALLLFQVGQLEQQREALARLAVTDPLTGVANRRHFGERLDEEVQRRSRSGRPFCLLLCDADHFKKVNDTWGHPAGDEVIRHIATVLAGHVRQHVDTVGRLGGEEFGVILADSELAAAQEVAERVLARMREHAFVAGGQRFRVTLSIGLHESRDGSGDDALRAADAALYRAKSNGRDRAEA